jgi:hypothetical protein
VRVSSERIERGLLFAVALVALATLIDSASFFFEPDKLGNDFKVFWNAVRTDTPYAPVKWPFAYPPTTLLWLQPLALLPLWVAFAFWIALSSLAYAVALEKEVGDKWPLAFFLFPTAFSLLTGQMSMLIASMVFTAFRVQATGLILGLAFTIKPQLVFLAPLAFLVLRDWRNLAWFFATVWFVTIVSLNWLGGALWVEWVQSFGHFAHRAEAMGILGGAASPAGLASWLKLNPLPFLLGGIVVGMGTLALGIKDSEHKGALLGLCCILASPYALIYDLVIILPLVLADLTRPSWKTLPAFMAVTVKFQVVGAIGAALGVISKKAIQANHGSIDKGIGGRKNINLGDC